MEKGKERDHLDDHTLAKIEKIYIGGNKAAV